MAEAKTRPLACQVRSKAENPCPRRAEVEILGVAFCGPCAREQEAYFAIGDLADEKARNFRGKPLAAALKRMRRGRVEYTQGTAVELHHGQSGVDEGEPVTIGRG